MKKSHDVQKTYDVKKKPGLAAGMKMIPPRLLFALLVLGLISIPEGI